ncbi:MAG: hypothetical protein HY740_09965 [Chloroflexi bacterium]|nr:hypothetical protein [Chloroflexota bacterium]
MKWKLHALTIEGDSRDEGILRRWHDSFSSLSTSAEAADIALTLDITTAVQPAPPRKPNFKQENLIEYYIDGDLVTVHFPRFGQLRLDLAKRNTEGEIVREALTTYGVFEDLIAIGLSPHLRRRDYFLIHAFAAVTPSPSPIAEEREGRGVLIVGNIGAGKTTTGMSLLNAGWKLLSNDSPIINGDAKILSYPGLLAAYSNTFARFEATKYLTSIGEGKITVAAEKIWREVWIESATAGMIVFPKIESRGDHLLEPLSQPEALRLIIPHAIEQWDKGMIPRHLEILNRLIQSAPAYRLHLSPDVLSIPKVIATSLRK